MKILFACGGTAGHINPALAVADTIRQKHPEADIQFIGNPKGMEAKLVPAAGYTFHPVAVMGLQRRVTPRNIYLNAKSACLLLVAPSKIRKILRKFAPQVVVGTGGYVSGPVLYTAHRMGIKTLTHEQNAYPGITTKALSGKVDRVLLAVEDAKSRLPDTREYIITGNPVRSEVFTADRESARRRFGVEGRICILSFGGSLGAAKINEAMAHLIAKSSRGEDIHHIHATGANGVQEMPEMLQKLGANYIENPHVDIRTYIGDMHDCLAAADLVICRAGAITLSELQAAGRASVLIPSPNVAENHQYHNAMALGRRGAAIVLEEKELTGEKLCEIVGELLATPGRLRELGQKAKEMAVSDASGRIYKEIMALYK